MPASTACSTLARVAPAFRLLALAAALACAEPTPPNVVLVTLDTTRADHLGLYGYFRDTSPQLDAFAAGAIVYERALTPMATTLPAHTSILTARAPLEHGVLANLEHGGRRFAPAPGLRSFAEFCRDAAYRTGAFVSAAPLERGSGLEAGFEIYHQPGEGFPKRRGEFTANAALRWLGDVADGPFFLWVHFFDAHRPFDPPAGFEGFFEGGPELEAWLDARRVPESAGPSEAESTRELTNAYDAELRYQDTQLGRLLDALARRPDWGRTAVLILGDHGEGLWQHGENAHGGTWDEQLFVPFVMRVPGHPPQRVARPISSKDAIPTLLRALDAPQLEPFLAQATSEEGSASVMSQDTGRRRARAGYHLALTGSRFKYRRVDQGGAAFVEELYDLAEDPFELDNVAALHPAFVRELAADLDVRLDAQARAAQELRRGAPELAPEVDPELARRLEALGYAEDVP